MAKKPKNVIVAPTHLSPFSKDDKSLIEVVIETPKSCRNKYAFDPKLGSFRLKKVLPSGMDFPYDFGFVPSTEADDGDPIDVLLLMDQPAFPGCVIQSRLIGVIEGEQQEDGEKERNDRLVAVADCSHTHSDLDDIRQLNSTLVEQIGEFFVNYHKLEGSKFKVIGVRGPKQAKRLLEKSLKKSKAA